MNLVDLRGKYTGKCAVILGAGPSLRHANESILAGRVSIALNDAINKFPMADFYMTMDPTMPTRRHWSVVLDGDFPVVLKEDGYRKIVGEGKAFSEDRALLIPWRKDVPDGKRSYKITQGDNDLIIGGSSAHSAVNFAVILGCKTIYLIGCDCRGYDGRHYYWNWEGQEQYVGGFAHEDPAMNIAHRDMKSDNILVSYVYKCWGALRAANPDITVVDASDGLLEGVLMTARLKDIQIG